MTADQRHSLAAIRAWCKRRGVQCDRIRHLHTRCYVLGYAGPSCLAVAVPWMDSEPLTREFDRQIRGVVTINRFDHALKPGDWCMTGYVVSPGTSALVAIPHAVTP